VLRNKNVYDIMTIIEMRLKNFKRKLKLKLKFIKGGIGNEKSFQ